MWDISLSDAPCEIPSCFKSKLNATTYDDLDSDVEPCVWAIVESCVAIFCACLPTFPALIKSIRDSRRRDGDPKSLSSLTSDSGRSGYGSSAENSCKEVSRWVIGWRHYPSRKAALPCLWPKMAHLSDGRRAFEILRRYILREKCTINNSKPQENIPPWLGKNGPTSTTYVSVHFSGYWFTEWPEKLIGFHWRELGCCRI